MWEAHEFGQALAHEGLNPVAMEIRKRRGSTWQAGAFRGRFIYTGAGSYRFERLFSWEA